MMEQIMEGLAVHFEDLGLGLAAVDHRGDAAGGAEFFDAGATGDAARKRV
jgi:hypothetical protein